MSNFLWPHECQASLSFPVSLSLLKLKSIESVMLSNHLILCCPLLLLPSIFLSIRVFGNLNYIKLGDQNWELSHPSKITAQQGMKAPFLTTISRWKAMVTLLTAAHASSFPTPVKSSSSLVSGSLWLQTLDSSSLLIPIKSPCHPFFLSFLSPFFFFFFVGEIIGSLYVLGQQTERHRLTERDREKWWQKAWMQVQRLATKKRKWKRGWNELFVKFCLINGICYHFSIYLGKMYYIFCKSAPLMELNLWSLDIKKLWDFS